jgi:hypothetical protein
MRGDNIVYLQEYQQRRKQITDRAYSVMLTGTLDEILFDRYNMLHNYRREGDKVYFYYDKKNNEYVVIAIKSGDHLSSPPFSLTNDLEITSEIFQYGIYAKNNGLVPITEQNISRLVKDDILSQEMAEVVLFNKNNVGFYF